MVLTTGAGQVANTINVGGFGFAAEEIEEVLIMHPDIDEIAAFSIRHPVLGEQVAVALKSKRFLAINELKEFCRNDLEPYKIPAKMIRMKILPKTHSGKIQRNLCREQLIIRGEI